MRLPRVVGINRARYMMFTGELVRAEEAASFGLVTKVYPDDSFEADVQALAENIAGKSPLGLKRMKMLIGQGFDLTTEDALKDEKRVSAEHMVSWDAAEGGRAFGEKRKPQFRGC